MKNVFPLAGLLVLACVSAPLSFAADYQGADAVLKKFAEQLKKAPDAAKPANPVDELRKKLAEFGKQAPTLSPEQAATQWLALLDIYAALPSEVLNSQMMANYEDRLSLQSFLEELPPGKDWDALTAKLESRKTANEWRDKGLHLLAAILRGDYAAGERVLKEIRAAAEDPNQASDRAMMYPQMVDMLEEQFAMIGNPDTQVGAFERRLAKLEGNTQDAMTMYGGGMITVPSLVKLVGEEKASALLQRALLLNIGLQVNDKETRHLAVKLALQSVDKLKRPQWGLVQEMEDAPLYAALAKRFPKLDPQLAYWRGSAATVYLVSLVMDNRIKEAAQFVSETRVVLADAGGLMDREATNYLLRQGMARPLNGLLRELLSNDPSLSYWSDYIQLSAQLGDSDKALAFLREVAARPNLSAQAREATNQSYVDALLAADQVDEGIKVLRETVQNEAKASVDPDVNTELQRLMANGAPDLAPALAPMVRHGHHRFEGSNAHLANCLRLARLGHLLGRPELIDEGFTAAQASLAKGRRSPGDSGVGEIADVMVEVGRGPEAEKLLSDAAVQSAGMPPGMGNNELGDRIEKLAVIYHLAGRHEDVVKLLEQSPYWRAADLSGFTGTQEFGVPMLYAAAQALAATGKKEEALRVTNRLLEVHGGYDPGYALFLELGGDGREARLDALMKLDRFQERPLIWKAKLHFDAGRIDEAEKAVRAAIAIDPSDGDEGKGDRMRAYAVLGDILEKKGDTAQAKMMRGVIEAIRLSENADDWWEVGLLQHAVKMYEEALGHFADAYCIQSRLALRYSELGDMAKAEQHYQRAFELMPESFGRIESHCFGCEGAFSGDRAQSIAERVFTKLAATPDAKPQVFYLLGYLREQQGRSEDAVEQFRKAVQLDPDYFNAWSHLIEVAERTGNKEEDAEKATLALLRIDPAMEHHSGSFNGLRNLRAVWDAILLAEKSRPAVESGPIFALPQAALEMERRRKAMVEMGQGEMADRFGMNEEWLEQKRNLRRAFLGNQALNMVGNFLEQVSRMQ